MKETRPRISKSTAWLARSSKVIPSSTQTFSKGPSQFVQGVAPVFLEKGDGSHVWDVDGNEYIDYSMALGTVILGYAYPATQRAISMQLEKGISFSLPHPLEVEVSEQLTQIIPCAEMVRFGKNGSDATAGAVRAARAYTGREKIACCGYHGWQDWYIGTTTRHRGIPEGTRQLTRSFGYNRLETLKTLFVENKNEIAAVIMEPVGVIPPEKDFLASVKTLCRENGALLIFDEVVTGFRISLGGAQEYYGVVPDIACFGKAMANGMPISAVAGRREIMEVFDEIFFSFTFGGETLSLASAAATIEEIRNQNVIKHLWIQGEKLKEGYNALTEEWGLQEYTRCIGLSPRTVITFVDTRGNESLELKTLFQQEAIKGRVLFSGGHNICFSHSDADIEETLEVYGRALKVCKSAIHSGNIRDCIEGEVIQPVFRKA